MAANFPDWARSHSRRSPRSEGLLEQVRGDRVSTRANGPRAPAWVDPGEGFTSCVVAPEEFDDAVRAARTDLLRGKKPVKAGETPHLLITIGAPGAGKSTVSAAVAARNPGRDYVTVDVDVHPHGTIFQAIPFPLKM